MSAPVDHRRERLQEWASDGPRSSLWYWRRHTGLIKTSINYVVIAVARVTPFFGVKNWLYRMVGADVHPYAAVGLEVTLDVLFPQHITIEEDAVVGFRTTILCHEYMTDRWRVGPVRIGRRATLGAHCLLLPGVVIGEGATVSAMSLVNRDVPAGEFWGGIPARPLRRGDAPEGAADAATDPPAP